MDDQLFDAEFPGSGPFAIPLLARFVSLDLKGDPDVAILQCAFEDGPRIHVPISSRVVAPLIEALAAWRIKLAEHKAENEPKH